MPTSKTLASFLRHLADRRSRSGRITWPETVRSHASALPATFAGTTDLGELAGSGRNGRDRLHANIRTADRHLGIASGGWNPHDLRHSRLTH